MRKRLGHRGVMLAVCLVLAVAAGLVLRQGGGLTAAPCGRPVVSVADGAADASGAGADSADEAVAQVPGAVTDEPNALAARAEEGPAYALVADDAQPATAQVDAADAGSYVPGVVLLHVAEGTSADELNTLLSQTDAVASAEVTEDELAQGLVEVSLAEGVSVEDAAVALAASPLVEDAQPDFVYYPMLGDARAFRACLARATALLPDGTELPGQVGAGAAAEEDEPAAGVTDDALASDPPSSDTAEPAVEATVPLATDADPGAEAEAPAGEASAQEGPSTGDPDASAGPADAPATSEDLLQALAAQVNDPDASNQWALASIRAYEAWAHQTCDGAVAVAIFDWAPDATHEDLAANVVATYDAKTKVAGLSIAAADHGTHVAGIAAAAADNGTGIAGVSHNADLVLVNVFYQNASGAYVTSTSTICDAYAYLQEVAAAYNVRVVNLSFGRGGTNNSAKDRELLAAVERAYEQGIVSVAAAGNSILYQVENGKTVPYQAPYQEFPGDAAHVASVINLREADPVEEGAGVTKAYGSNYNVANASDGWTGKNISAPGTSIYSTYPGNAYGSSDGTSMAAPHVTGTLALEFAANPALTAEQALRILYGTAADLGDEGFDDVYGWGEIDACAAVLAAQAGEVPELPEVTHIPDPEVKGATRVPVGATAAFEVTNGSLALKAGGSCATLQGSTLTGTAPGTVTLAVLDSAGVERATRNVVVYDAGETWLLASAQNQDYVLDVSGGSVLNKANVALYQKNGRNNQVWLLETQADGTFVVRSGKSGKVLDVAGGSKATGANVAQYAEGGKAWQHWRLAVNADNSLTLANAHSGLVLEVQGGVTGNSKNVRQAADAGADGQHWVLKKVTADIGPVWDGVYRVSSGVNRSFVLDVKRGSTANGANVQLYRSNGGENQKWRFEYLGKGVYKIWNVKSGKVLDVARGARKNSVNIDQWSWNKGAHQRWELASYADGSYAIVRAGTSWVVDVKGGKANNSQNVHQYQRKNNAAQKWYLTQY